MGKRSAGSPDLSLTLDLIKINSTGNYHHSPSQCYYHSYFLCGLGIFMAFLTLYVAYFYIQLFAIEFDMASLQKSNYLVTILGAGSILGRLIPNGLSDRLGSLNVCIAVTMVSGILSLGWLGIRHLVGLAIFAFLYGFSSGAIVSSTPNVILSLSPDMAVVGTRMGMIFCTTSASVLVLVGRPIAGIIVRGYNKASWMGCIGYSAAGLLPGGLAFAACGLEGCSLSEAPCVEGLRPKGLPLEQIRL